MAIYNNATSGAGALHFHCLQHAAFENPGTILEWIAVNNHTISYTYFFNQNFSFPSLDDIDVLLVMGGIMNVYEEQQFPWLKEEKQFIKAAAGAGKKIIGICLGSQLVAAALGARVYKNKETEIGFFPVSFTHAAMQHQLFSHFKNPYNVFQWHGDTFDLPANAILIASSEICKHQAYLAGDNILGLQFHFEINETIIEDMLLHDGHELQQHGASIHTPQQIRKNFFHLQQNKKDMFLLLDKFFAA